jgi:hypothetical protein
LPAKQSSSRGNGAAKKTRDAKAIANEIARAGDVDIALYNGLISRFHDEDLIVKSLERRRRKNLLLLLVTEGGDPDAAYKMARCLQSRYEKFSLFVSGYCKSAGTLVAIGAHELVFSAHGELGPLDVQMAKKDELLDRQSGLTVIAGLDFLREKAYSSFEKIFYDLEEKTGGVVTVQTASKIAVELVNGVISPISSQIDPLHVGEAARSLRVAEQYGVRLAQISKSIERSNLLRLLTGYASHGFVIDRREAGYIFANVRDATPLELEFAEAIGTNAKRPIVARPSNPPVFFDFFTQEVQNTTGVSHAKRTTNRRRRVGPAVSGVQHARAGQGAGASNPTRSGIGARARAAKKAGANARSARKGNGLSMRPN